MVSHRFNLGRYDTDGSGHMDIKELRDVYHAMLGVDSIQFDSLVLKLLHFHLVVCVVDVCANIFQQTLIQRSHASK